MGLNEKVICIFKFMIIGIVCYAAVGLVLGLILDFIGINTLLLENVTCDLVILHSILGLILLIRVFILEMINDDSCL